MFVDSVFKGDVSFDKFLIDLSISNSNLLIEFIFQAKVIAQQMIEQIREAFKENLQSLSWMDVNTKKLATEKVSF